MSPRFPAVTAKEVLRVLQRQGFVIDRVTGSHYILHHEDGRRVVVPFHADVILKRKTLKGILRGAGLTVIEFNRLRRER